MSRHLSVGAAVLLAMFLAGCGEEEGPAEQMGQNVDEAVEQMAEQVKSEGPAERAGENIDQAMDKAGDTIQKAGETVGEAMQEAGQQIEQNAGGG